MPSASTSSGPFRARTYRLGDVPSSMPGTGAASARPRCSKCRRNRISPSIGSMARSALWTRSACSTWTSDCGAMSASRATARPGPPSSPSAFPNGAAVKKKVKNRTCLTKFECVTDPATRAAGFIAAKAVDSMCSLRKGSRRATVLPSSFPVWARLSRRQACFLFSSDPPTRSPWDFVTQKG